MADKVYSIQVTLTDGTEISAGEFIVPEGDRGLVCSVIQSPTNFVPGTTTSITIQNTDFNRKPETGA